jgi:hypothetical protein
MKKTYLFSTMAALAIAATAVFFTIGSRPQATSEAPDGFQPWTSASSWAQQAQLSRADIPSSWLSQIQEAIKNEQYSFVADGNNKYTATHKGQDLKFEVNPEGFKVSGNDWNAAISLNGIRSNSGMLQAGDVQHVTVEKNRLVYSFGDFDVEYLNGPQGLRQNFIIHRNAVGQVDVLQQIASSLKSDIQNNSLVLSRNGEKIYTYTDMKVWDSNNKTIAASMSLENGQLAMAVDASNAVFPLTIDPVSTTYSWKVEGDNLNAGFGFWIAGNGDLNGDGFDDVVIGAPEYTNTYALEGAFMVYYGSTAGLPLTPDFVYYGNQENAAMGKCISIEGDVNSDGYDDILVGSHQFRNPSEDEGKVFLFYGGPSGVSPTPGWEFEANRKKAKLGEAVTMAGDLNGDGYDDVCVGAHAWDNEEEMGDLGNKAGKFWVFNGGPSGLSTVPAMECVADVTDANLGISMDRAGDVNGDGYDDLHVGGYIFLIGDGMICTFHGGPGGADGTPDFMAIGGAHDTSFYATNLSAAGDVNGDGYDDVFIGAPRFDTDGIYQSGKLHLHYGGPTGLDTTIGWTVKGTQWDERFAFNVNDGRDLNNDGYDDVLVTSKYFIPEGLTDSVGKSMIYLGGPNGPSMVPNWEFVGESTNGAGQNTCLAGDVNGDGQEDILVSGSAYTGELAGEGVVYGFYGIAQRCDPPVDFVVEGIAPSSATFTWKWVFGSTTYKLFLKELGAPGSPLALNLSGNSITVSGLKPGTSYQCYVKARCEDGFTNRSETIIIQTPPMRTEDEVEVAEPNIYPNPVRDRMSIDFGTNVGTAKVIVFDMSGTQLMEMQYDLENNRVVELNDMAALPDGVYLITLDINNVRTTKKITKTN